MKRIELILNGVSVPLENPADLGLRINTILSDSNNIDARGGTFTYTIRLPWTNELAKALGGGFDLQAIDTFNKGQPDRVEVFIDSVRELSGLFRIRETDRDRVSGEIYSDDISWVQQVEGKSLREIASYAPLPFDPFSTTEGLPYYIASAPGREPIAFPLNAYGLFPWPEGSETGQDSIVHLFDWDDWMPSFHYLTIIRNIFADIGWSAKGSIFQDGEVNSLVMPYTGEGKFIWNWGRHGRFYWNVSAGDIDNPFGYVRYTNIGIRYRMRDRYGVRVIMRNLGIFPNLRVRHYDAREGSADSTLKSVALGIMTQQPGNVFVFDSELSYESTQFEIGDILVIDCVDSLSGGFFPNLEDWPAIALTGLVVEVRPDAPQKIDVAANLPDIGQKEFVKSFVSLFNLFFDADPDSRTITFYGQGQFYREPEYAVDISPICDAAEAKKIPAPVLKRLRFEHTRDEADALTEGSQQRYNHLVVNRTLNAAGENLVQSLFSPTASRQFQGGFTTPQGELYSYNVDLATISDTESLNTPNKKVVWQYGYVPRLLALLPPQVFSGAGIVRQIPIGQGGIDPSGQPLPPVTVDLSTAEFPEWLYWKALYEKHYRTRANPRGHLLTVSASLTPDIARRLRERWNVELAGETYRLVSMDSYDPLGNNETVLKLEKVV